MEVSRAIHSSCYIGGIRGPARLTPGVSLRSAHPASCSRSARSFQVVKAKLEVAEPEPPVVPGCYRRVNRVVFDFDAWNKHRRRDRYANNMLSIPSSRILDNLTGPLLWLFSFSSCICLYESARASGTLAGYPSLLLHSPEPQALTSFALALLLVFRTNSSYGRFDEARKIWGLLLNRCRNLMQQVVTYLPDDDQVTKDAIGRWTIAFARALQGHLQEDAVLKKELSHVLNPEELEVLLAAPHRPIKALSVISELLRQTSVDPWRLQNMQIDLTTFFDCMGACERILKTPIPLSYTRHTSRFLLIWLTALPLGLWEHCEWSLVPITVMIGYMLLGIEEIGVQIEEPFGILPLGPICQRVEIDTNDLLRERDGLKDFVVNLRDTTSVAGIEGSEVNPKSPALVR